MNQLKKFLLKLWIWIRIVYKDKRGHNEKKFRIKDIMVLFWPKDIEDQNSPWLQAWIVQVLKWAAFAEELGSPLKSVAKLGSFHGKDANVQNMVVWLKSSFLLYKI